MQTLQSETIRQLQREKAVISYKLYNLQFTFSCVRLGIWNFESRNLNVIHPRRRGQEFLKRVLIDGRMRGQAPLPHLPPIPYLPSHISFPPQ